MIGEFFINLWNGIVYNKDTIFTVINSAEFVTLITLVIGFIRNIKTMKDNALNNQLLRTDLTKLDDLKSTLDDAVAENSALRNTIAEQQSEITALKEQNSIILSKINTMLEVQSIVYSTSVKDNTIRTTVVNLLTNAKHTEISQISKLKAQLEDLQVKVVEKAQSVADEVNKAVDNAKTNMTNNVMRC